MLLSSKILYCLFKCLKFVHFPFYRQLSKEELKFARQLVEQMLARKAMAEVKALHNIPKTDHLGAFITNRVDHYAIASFQLNIDTFF